jgi:hypothetical protein
VPKPDEPAEAVPPEVAAAIVDIFVYVVDLNLFGSKFLVLETVNIVFGSRVSLGGFFSVTLLIVSLLLSRAAVRRLLRRGPAPTTG